MNELLQKLINEVGLTPEQAHKSVDAVKEYIKSKVPPAFGGIIDSFLQGEGLNAFMAQAKEKAQEMREEAKENIDEFRAEAKEELKEASEKADKLANEALHKIKDLFGGNKAD